MSCKSPQDRVLRASLSGLSIALCAVVPCLLAACRSPEAPSTPAGDAPGWVRAPREHPLYPPERFLIGLGTSVHPNSATAFERARADATQEIAAELETHIRARFDLVRSQAVAVSDGAVAETWEQSSRSRIRQSTEASLRFAETVAQFYDTGSKTAWLLVALDRSRRTADLRRELAQARDAIHTLEEHADRLAGRGDRFQAVVRYASAIERAQDAFRLDAEASFIDGKPQGPGLGEATRLTKKLRDVASRTRVTLVCEYREFGESAPTETLESIVHEALSDIGFRVEILDAPAGHDLAEFLAKRPRVLDPDADGRFLVAASVTSKSRPTSEAQIEAYWSEGWASVLDQHAGEVVGSTSIGPNDLDPDVRVSRQRTEAARSTAAQVGRQLVRQLLGDPS